MKYKGTREKQETYKEKVSQKLENRVTPIITTKEKEEEKDLF